MIVLIEGVIKMVDWNNMTFGEKIKHAREAMGLSQNKLAQLSGMAQSSISYLESGEKKPNLETITLIAKALDLPVSNLIDPQSVDNVLPPNIAELAKIASQLSTENVKLLIAVAKAMDN